MLYIGGHLPEKGGHLTGSALGLQGSHEQPPSHVITDVMTLLAEIWNNDPFTVLLIDGHCGCRGTTFKDREHCTNPKSGMRLTELFS